MKNKQKGFIILPIIIIFAVIVIVWGVYSYKHVRNITEKNQSQINTSNSKSNNSDSVIKKICDYITGENKEYPNQGEPLDTQTPFSCYVSLKGIPLTINFKAIPDKELESSTPNYFEVSLVNDKNQTQNFDFTPHLVRGKFESGIIGSFNAGVIKLRNDFNADGYNDLEIQEDSPGDQQPHYSILLFNKDNHIFEENNSASSNKQKPVDNKYFYMTDEKIAKALGSSYSKVGNCFSHSADSGTQSLCNIDYGDVNHDGYIDVVGIFTTCGATCGTGLFSILNDQKGSGTFTRLESETIIVGSAAQTSIHSVAVVNDDILVLGQGFYINGNFDNKVNYIKYRL